MARRSRVGKFWESTCIILVNIILPTLDVYSDLVLIVTHLQYKVVVLAGSSKMSCQ